MSPTVPAPPAVDGPAATQAMLAAKVSVPATRSTVLVRPRLFTRLTEGVGGPLTVVSAAAGSGKTTLVASWLASGAAPGRVAWLTLDQHDNQPGVFWWYVVQSLRRNGVRLPTEVGMPLRPDEVERSFLAAMALALADRVDPVLLVLDQFEALTNKAVTSDLDYLLQLAAPGLRLVVISRADPGPLVHRQLLRTDVAEIGPADLAFDEGEAAAVLGQHGVSLSADALAGLQRQVRGWAAGLRLSAIAMQRQVDPDAFVAALPASGTRLADYLVDEVLDAQNEEVREFLLQTSVVDRVCGPLAEMITGRPDADILLDTMVRANLLVEASGDNPRWFGYHPLFAQVLRSELRRRRPDTVPALHLRAGAWYDEQGLFPDAARQFAAAGDWWAACRAVVRRLGVVPLLEDRASTTLTEIFAGMPAQPGSAMEAALHAALAMASRDLVRAAAMLERADAGMAQEAAADRGALRTVCALTRVVLARAQLDARAAQAAWEQFDAGLSTLSVPGTAEPNARALGLSALAGTQMWTGDFATAEDTVHRALAAAAGEGCEYSRLLALGKLALFAYRSGRLHDAANYGRQALRLAEEAGLPSRHRTGLGHLVLSVVALEWNDRAAFDRHLDTAAATTDAQQDPVVGFTVAMTLAFRWGIDGRRAEALAVLDSLPNNVGGSPIPPWLSTRAAITRAAINLRCGSPELARSALDRAVVRGSEWRVTAAAASCATGDTATALQLVEPILRGDDPAVDSGLVHAFLLAARMRVDAGDRAGARRYLQQAIDHARPEELRRPFIEARGWLWPLISESPDILLAASWIGPSITAGPRDPAGQPSDVASALVEPLTDRERTVLARMALAMSVIDIAADLHVSVNTVKTHQKSLYRKLSVQRAYDAVRRGRQMQII
jgi:LuxR family maltose regulon positive regulatory protein